jgi:hypothetical protein
MIGIDSCESIAAINSGVFIGDLEWRILGLGCAEGYMSSKHELVSVSGRLQGMGRDVACTVFAALMSMSMFVRSLPVLRETCKTAHTS